MTRKLPTHDVILDAETGGLRVADRPWEVGFVVDAPGQEPELHHLYVSDFDPSQADPIALQMSGFYERHPMHRLTGIGRPMDPNAAMTFDDHGLAPTDPDGPPRPVHFACVPEDAVMRHLSWYLRDARLVIVNPVYDHPRITAGLERAGLAMTAYYQPVCVSSYAAGALGMDPCSGGSDVLAERLGVKREDYGTGHTALVDALYGRGILRAAEDLRGVKPHWMVEHERDSVGADEHHHETRGEEA